MIRNKAPLRLTLAVVVLLFSGIFCEIPRSGLQQRPLEIPRGAALANLTAPLPSPTPITCSVIAAEALNLRSGPGVSYPVLAWLKPDAVLIRTTEPARGAWWEIVTPAGLRGWIHSRYCHDETH